MAEPIELFQAIEAKFESADLSLLVPDNAAIRVALLQHEGDVEANSKRIGDKDVKSATDQHLAFIKLVQSLKPAPALVVTPEYSTPWAAVEKMLESKMYPATGSVWMLGCESITPDALKSLIGKYQEIFWWSEVDDLSPGNKVYVDPLLLIFRGKEKGGARTVAIGIQFKSQPMGGAEGQVERDHLIVGKKRILIRHKSGSIALVPLLCSDVIDFKHTSLKDFQYWSYFLVHLQCTDDPYRGVLTTYRQVLYTSNEGDTYGCLALNWARGTRVEGQEKKWRFGGSGLYFRPTRSKRDNEPRQDDASINANHSQGVYLKFCGEWKSAGYFFATHRLVLDFYMTKPDQRATVGAQDRAGVSKVTSYLWEKSAWVSPKSIEDGVSARVVSANIKSLIPLKTDPAARERLVAFSTGNFDADQRWHVPNLFRSYQVEQGTELPGGTRVWLRKEQDAHIDRTLQEFRTLEADIVPTKLPTLKEFSDLKGKKVSLVLVKDKDGRYTSNLALDGKPANAAAIFIGDRSEAAAQRVLDDLQGIVRVNRAVVWYRDIDLKNVSTPPPSFMSTDQDPRAITRARKNVK